MKVKLLSSLFLTLFFCIAQAATPPNATIYYPSPWCPSYGELQVILEGTSGGTFSATPGLVIDPITGTISPGQSPSGNFIVTYTIPANGQDPAFMCTATVVLFPEMIPMFSFPTQYCSGSDISGFPTTSDNGVTGTWSPAVIDNQITTTYTFTPNPGQCASPIVVTVVIGEGIQPEFGFNGNSFCMGAAPALPTTSLNGISGTWSPSVIQASGIYTFTPDLNQCAYPINQFFTVNPLPTATISGSTTVCQGQAATLTINGTPNSIITYLVNNTPQTIVLGSSGTATFVTPTLMANIMYCLVSATSGGILGCTANLNGCAVISVVPTVTITPMPDVTVCGTYTLPPLPIGNYYLLPGGTGPMLQPGEVITTTTMLYVHASNSCGFSEDSFMVTVFPSFSPVITTESNADYIYVDGTDVVQSLLLNAQIQGNYSYQWTLFGNDILGANGPTYLVNAAVQGGTHAYTVRVTNLDMGCITESLVFEVHETPVPAPVGDPNQIFILGQTLADVIVYGQNIQWYDSLNRGVNSVVLPLSTVLQEGVTYYATQTINGHESPSAFAITIQFLATDSFAFRDLKFAPNPVRDFIQLSSKDLIQKITVLNLMGQKVLEQNVNTLEFSLPMSQLKTGNYFVKLESDNKSQVIKVIKE